jgi:hypothetical protein
MTKQQMLAGRIKENFTTITCQFHRIKWYIDIEKATNISLSTVKENRQKLLLAVFVTPHEFLFQGG